MQPDTRATGIELGDGWGPENGFLASFRRQPVSLTMPTSPLDHSTGLPAKLVSLGQEAANLPTGQALEMRSPIAPLRGAFLNQKTDRPSCQSPHPSLRPTKPTCQLPYCVQEGKKRKKKKKNNC